MTEGEVVLTAIVIIIVGTILAYLFSDPPDNTN
jgi:hypothetical protein